jgi:chorismate synthase
LDTGRVAASTIAEKYLSQAYGTSVTAFVTSVGSLHLFDQNKALSEDENFLELSKTITRQKVDEFLPVRCPNAAVEKQMEDLIAKYRDEHDSIGGTVTCVIRNVPAGLGEPCFDKLEAALAHAMLSIPASKGFEIGSGFAGAEIPGSRHNDAFIPDPHVKGKLLTKTNHSGGIQGGISLSPSVPIFFKVAFKPPATISVAQETATYTGETGTLAAKGRHDPCVVPRAVPIVEAMASLVIMDAVIAQEARMALRSRLPVLQSVLRPDGWVVGTVSGKSQGEQAGGHAPSSTVAEVGLATPK